MKTRLTSNKALYFREDNTKAVMHCIRKNGPLSRSEVGEKTQISKPTVTRVTNALIQDGFLEEINAVKTARGRHPVNLDLRADAAYTFGVNIFKNHLSVALVDFKLNVVDTAQLSIRGLESVSQFLELIADTVLEMQQKNGVSTEKVLGIGVGAPGLIEDGVVKDFALWGKLRNIPLAEFLCERTSFKTKVDNNCNTWLFGEMWNGYAQDCSDALFILNSEGVGCGIAQAGVIRDISGGLGHISVNFHGDRCYCGSRGCIETYCSTDHIEQKTQERLVALQRVGDTHRYPLPIDFKTICRIVENGDMLFADILLEAAAALACGIVSLIKIFYPQIIILSGTLFEASNFYYNSVVMEIQSQLSSGMALPKFVRRNVSDTLFEIGAAALILQEIF